MKFLLTVAAVIAVAVAGPTQRGLVAPGAAGPAPVDPVAILPAPAPAPAPQPPLIPAPAPAPAPESFEPIAIGPALIDNFEPIAIGPAFIDSFEVVPAPASAPLVKIILNINLAAESSPVAVSPVQVVDNSPEQVIDVMPVVIPDQPINIIDVTPVVVPEVPVEIVDVMPVIVQPVNVVDTAPVAVEPIIIGTPMLPSPAVVLPEELN